MRGLNEGGKLDLTRGGTNRIVWVGSMDGDFFDLKSSTDVNSFCSDSFSANSCAIKLKGYLRNQILRYDKGSHSKL